MKLSKKNLLHFSNICKNKQICVVVSLITVILLVYYLPTAFTTNLGNVVLLALVVLLTLHNKMVGLLFLILVILVIIYMRIPTEKISKKEGFGAPSGQTYLVMKNSTTGQSSVVQKPMDAATGPLVPGTANTSNSWTLNTMTAIQAYGAKRYPRSVTFVSAFVDRYQSCATDNEVIEFTNTGLWPWTQDVTTKFKRSFMQHYTKNGGTESQTSANIMDIVVQLSRVQLTNANAIALTNNMNMYSVWIQYMVSLAKQQ